MIETGAPLCTPVPVSAISLASVVWRAPINPLMPPSAPKPYVVPYERGFPKPLISTR